MDRTSQYRQIRLVVDVGVRRCHVSLLARSVSGGVVSDRLLSRRTLGDPVQVRTIRGVLDLLHEVTGALLGEFEDVPLPEAPEPPEGATGGPVP